MQLLVRPKPFLDESLESYLLRLTEANFIESYRLMSGAIKEWLLEKDHEAGGAFPLDLATANIWHARQSSSFRIRAFLLLEKLTDNEELPLLALSMRHSAADFCGGYRALARGGVHTPRCFIRKSTIPVCPLCLSENTYIPQAWHYQSYTACVRHGVKLIDKCPSCGESLSYLESEIIGNCCCGYELRLAKTIQANEKNILLGRLITCEEIEFPGPLGHMSSISIRNAALLYYCTISSVNMEDELEVNKSLLLAMDFYANWPFRFRETLSENFNKVNERLIRPYNKTPISFAIGSCLSSAIMIKGMREEENFILCELFGCLKSIVGNNPRSRVGNRGDMLLTIVDAAVLLRTTHEQIYLLLGSGYLKAAGRIKIYQKVSPHEPIFYLRQVIELAESRMPSDFGVVATYLPHW